MGSLDLFKDFEALLEATEPAIHSVFRRPVAEGEVLEPCLLFHHFGLQVLDQLVQVITHCHFLQGQTNGGRPAVVSSPSLEPGASVGLQQGRADAVVAIEIASRTAKPATRIGRPIWWKFGDVEAELLEDEVGSSDVVFESLQEEVGVVVHVSTAGPASKNAALSFKFQ